MLKEVQIVPQGLIKWGSKVGYPGVVKVPEKMRGGYLNLETERLFEEAILQIQPAYRDPSKRDMGNKNSEFIPFFPLKL